VDAGKHPAGARSVTLDPRAARGTALSTGVYFVQMSIDGHPAARQRLVWIE
jgi:hypothetical protein